MEREREAGRSREEVVSGCGEVGVVEVRTSRIGRPDLVTPDGIVSVARPHGRVPLDPDRPGGPVVEAPPQRLP